MKKILSLIFAITTLYLATSAQSSIDASKFIKSTILKKDMRYSVYLPPSYATSSRAYPVLYLLHGMWGDHTNWSVKGEVKTIADKAIAEGRVPEIIIVMPEGLTDAFYINNYDGSVRWEDFFYTEMMPQVEKEFRIISQKNYRVISGLSMGGYGAIYHALNHPEKYKGCYAMSAAVLDILPEKDGKVTGFPDKTFRDKTWGPADSTGFPKNYLKHSIQEKVRTMNYRAGSVPADQQLPSIMLDCGDDDFLLFQNLDLLKLMRSKNIPVELRVRDGGHVWEYWRTGLALALDYAGNLLRN